MKPNWSAISILEGAYRYLADRLDTEDDKNERAILAKSKIIIDTAIKTYMKGE